MIHERSFESTHRDFDGGETCLNCGHSQFGTVWKDHPFPYGSGPNPVTIHARIPVHICPNCDFEFLDAESEEAIHDAVCRHLGVLTPNEIRALREKRSLSRFEFARLTGLGDATIARWERGELIQDAANDRYLRLLERNADEGVGFLRALKS